MTKSFLFIPIFCALRLNAQRTVVHTDLLSQLQANGEYKVMMNKGYENKLNQVKDHREKTLGYTTAIEQVQEKIFKSLTNVDAAIRNGKTILYISRKIPLIFGNLAEASRLAAGKPFLATIAADHAQVITERVVKLQNYLQDFVLKDDAQVLINPTDRSKLVYEVYQNVLIIHSMSNALVRTFQMYNLQDAVNKVVPFQTYINVDKILITDIVNKVKL